MSLCVVWQIWRHFILHQFPLFHQGVLLKIIEAATAETTARMLCQMGDKLIEEETSKVYKKEKELKKGTNIKTFCWRNKLFEKFLYVVFW